MTETAPTGIRSAGCLETMGIQKQVSSPRSPWQNANVERLIGSIRREGTDHIIPMSEGHLRRTLAEYVEYYNADRPHQSLNGESPDGRMVESAGAVAAHTVLGELHHRYSRAAKTTTLGWFRGEVYARGSPTSPRPKFSGQDSRFEARTTYSVEGQGQESAQDQALDGDAAIEPLHHHGRWPDDKRARTVLEITLEANPLVGVDDPD